MKRLSPGLLCQIYLLLVLLAASIVSTLPYVPLTLALLSLMLFVTFRPPSARLNVTIMVVTIFLVPLVLAPILNRLTSLPSTIVSMISATSIIPGIYLLDCNLQQNAAQIRTCSTGRTGRYTTNICRSLLASALVMLLVSVIIGNLTLLFTDIIFALYLLGTLTVIFIVIPRLPLHTPPAWRKVIAGTNIDISLNITSRASPRVYCLITPLDSWVKVMPERFVLKKGKTKLSLSVTPPLAGPSRPQLQVSALDRRGFLQVNQLIEPVALHVIPRAKYAEWLAMKYLELTGTGVIPAAMLPPRTIMIPKRGIEYHDSRTYQAGDQLRDIDWKHTLKLSQIIVREYTDSGEQAAIIAVNLSVADAEEADKLAFSVITAALTLAQERIPTALAAYNHQKVITTTAVTDPREILIQTLSLVKDFTATKFTPRHLELPDIAKLRRNITHLKQAKSEPAQRLLGMLNFEYRAIEKAAKNHPATIALSSVTRYVPPPAMIIVVSQLNHDAEALMVTTEKLARREFITISLPITR